MKRLVLLTVLWGGCKGVEPAAALRGDGDKETCKKGEVQGFLQTLDNITLPEELLIEMRHEESCWTHQSPQHPLVKYFRSNVEQKIMTFLGVTNSPRGQISDPDRFITASFARESGFIADVLTALKRDAFAPGKTHLLDLIDDHSLVKHKNYRNLCEYFINSSGYPVDKLAELNKRSVTKEFSRKLQEKVDENAPLIVTRFISRLDRTQKNFLKALRARIALIYVNTPHDQIVKALFIPPSQPIPAAWEISRRYLANALVLRIIAPSQQLLLHARPSRPTALTPTKMGEIVITRAGGLRPLLKFATSGLDFKTEPSAEYLLFLDNIDKALNPGENNYTKALVDKLNTR